jgi:hypothetical protein
MENDWQVGGCITYSHVHHPVLASPITALYTCLIRLIRLASGSGGRTDKLPLCHVSAVKNLHKCSRCYITLQYAYTFHFFVAHECVLRLDVWAKMRGEERRSDTNGSSYESLHIRSYNTTSTLCFVG